MSNYKAVCMNKSLVLTSQLQTIPACDGAGVLFLINISWVVKGVCEILTIQGVDTINNVL